MCPNSTTCHNIALLGKTFKPKEMKPGPITCKEKYHENETVEYYCVDCSLAICHKCSVLSHKRHNLQDIQKVAEESKLKMKKCFDSLKTKIDEVEAKLKTQIKMMKSGEYELNSVEIEMTENIDKKIRILNEHKTDMKKKLAKIRKEKQAKHEGIIKSFEELASNLTRNLEYGEDIIQRSTDPEILEVEDAINSSCEHVLNAEQIELWKPPHVSYVVERSTLAEGQVIVSPTDPSTSTVQGKRLREAELGAESNFTLTTRDSEGNRCYVKEDKVIVTISSRAKEDVDTRTEDCKNGTFKVSYNPKTAGVHDILVEINGKPLKGSPWCVQVTPHMYQAIGSFGSCGDGQGQFSMPWNVAVSERTGNIAVADVNRVQLFDTEWKYLRTIGDKKSGDDIVDSPSSVAFTAYGDVVVIHRKFRRRNRMSIFTEHGNLVTHITEHLINPWIVSVGTDGNLTVCDGGDNTVKVLSRDGKYLIQTVCDLYCNEAPRYAICYQDMVFVSYAGSESCVKVFGKDGQLLYKIGCTGTDDGQLKDPTGLTIDRFGNLVVCDCGNVRIQVFSLEGKFWNSVNEAMEAPKSVSVTLNGELLVLDSFQCCIHVLS